MNKYVFVGIILFNVMVGNMGYSEVITEIIKGREYESPNKSYSVKVIDTKDYNQLIVIKNIPKNLVEAKIEIETPVNELQWGPESNCIIAQRHIASGSFCTIIYQKNNIWEQVGYLPVYKGNPKKSIYEDSMVERIQVDDNKALIKYKSRDMTPNGSYYKERKTVIKVDLNTRKSKVIADDWD